MLRSVAIAAIASVPFWAMASDWKDLSEAKSTLISVITVAAINAIAKLSYATDK